MAQKLSISDAMDKIIRVHGNLYSYPNFNYCDGGNTLLDIVCPKHGPFQLKYTHHVHRKLKCKKCLNGRTTCRTTGDVINQCNVVHNNKYDYTKFVYTKRSEKSVIICSIHGEFSIYVNDHIRGQGCRFCSGKLTTVDVIDRFIIQHGDKFDYSVVVYKSMSDPIVIGCPIHGQIITTPEAHQKSVYGCIHCSGSLTLSTEEFIIRSKQVHLDRFDYSTTRYVNSSTLVELICKQHGPFLTRPANHIFNGTGCPVCTESKGSRLINQYLILHKIDTIKEYKFLDCVNPKTMSQLRFDFYLPDYNTCIEYDGEGHYIDFSFGGHKSNGSNLIEYQYRDAIKTEYCRLHNIQLIRIPYFDIDNIDTILTNQLIL
jgi:hypothetical protein